MLYGIPKILSPQLVRILMEMGHGDELVLADANFPIHSIAKSTVTGEVAYSQGCGAVELLDAILKLMPLDYAVEQPVCGMAVREGMDTPPIHGEFAQVMKKHGYQAEQIAFLPRFDFYDRAKQSYAVVASGETARFANIIVKKGVVQEPSCADERKKP